MAISPSRVAAATFLLCGSLVVAQAVPDDPEGRALVEQARRIISEYHAGQPKSDAVLRVVYFVPNDCQPLADYEARLDRVLKDVSDFYRDGLRRFGIENHGLPVELKNGRLVLHLVRGKLASGPYGAPSGGPAKEEIRAALKDKFDIDREHVLVLYAMSRKEPDGSYTFDSPHPRGSGNQASGMCHSGDGELLDPQLLTSMEKMSFVWSGGRVDDVTVAFFNSNALGTTAHELGHAFGLFHEAGMIAEAGFGTNIMGYAPLNYRNDLRGEKAPAFLPRAAALHLASHPLFTQSNRERWKGKAGECEGHTFDCEPKTLRIRGRVTGDLPAYAVMAHVWRRNAEDYSSRTYAAMVKERAFELPITELSPDLYFMRLTSLHVNGGKEHGDYHIEFDGAGKPVAPQAFKWPWIVKAAEDAVVEGNLKARSLLSEESIAKAPEPDQRLLRALRRSIDPVPALDLKTIADNTAWLSDAAWVDAKVGWGQVTRNYHKFDAKKKPGALLVLGGQMFDKGLYAHADSRFVFDLDGKWKTFTATAGLRDGAPEFGSAIFRVVGDGKELYRSPVLKAGAREAVKVRVEGMKQLELIAEGGEGNNHGSWAIWAAPAVSR
jgi:hypothetical protein